METPKEVISTKQILEQLEPIAANAPVNTLQQRGMQEVAMISAAISLKRIADALQPTEQSGRNSIPEALHGIMMNGRT